MAPLAYISLGHRHGAGAGLLTYLAHYLIALGVWRAIERLAGGGLLAPIAVGVVLLLVLAAFRRRRWALAPTYTGSEERLRARQTPRWRRLRSERRSLAHNRCERCGQRVRSGRRFDLHHLTYRRLGHERLSDVRFLCHDCHQKVHAARF